MIYLPTQISLYWSCFPWPFAAKSRNTLKKLADDVKVETLIRTEERLAYSTVRVELFWRLDSGLVSYTLVSTRIFSEKLEDTIHRSHKKQRMFVLQPHSSCKILIRCSCFCLQMFQYTWQKVSITTHNTTDKVTNPSALQSECIWQQQCHWYSSMKYSVHFWPEFCCFRLNRCPSCPFSVH